MLKALLITAAACSVLAGCATSTPKTADGAAAKTPPVSCLKTGSRIQLKDGECANVSGHAFTRDDLDRTGAISVEEALRRLDPTVF
jgi:hypothetical protein